jgi:hypothetical protein|tara:strand:- start:565 stop:1068 length:504 start_codon:yes stop_codon:yes gene_type:complete
MVPDTLATSMNQHRKINASRNKGSAVKVVLINNCPSRKFFIALNGRKHRTALMAMNCDPIVVNSDETVPITSKKSNWFHPDARYESLENKRPWSRIFNTASTANKAVYAFSKPSAKSVRGVSALMFSLAIDAVFATITANTNTSNAAVYRSRINRMNRVEMGQSWEQ